MPIVYLLTNPAMPGLVKIGFSDRPIEVRLKELARPSGVPIPFECFLAIEVDEAEEVEIALHEAFADRRLNARREFFDISPDQPAAILRLFQKRSQQSRDAEARCG